MISRSLICMAKDGLLGPEVRKKTWPRCLGLAWSLWVQTCCVEMPIRCSRGGARPAVDAACGVQGRGLVWSENIPKSRAENPKADGLEDERGQVGATCGPRQGGGGRLSGEHLPVSTLPKGPQKCSDPVPIKHG